ncbi:MAG: right-handed parallel beta-helix repeat-containing protein [Proteobacteria bacterium]|nr:right-handed parallel beta-helix repeat-containing protein [Pseudomonadota bacterium]MBU1688654.1 right-handed parallel beta-helix repeat-containing protein [Pseudomonadota bacterium]
MLIPLAKHRQCFRATGLFWLTLILLFIHPAPVLAKGKFLKSQVLRQDTTWAGDITIEGVIVVGRATTLTISPGTQVSFKKIDENHDGIGDSEIRVLGRILAEGSPEQMIRFASAENSPAPKDWSYLLLFTSGSFNRIRYCEFQHGFSGLQVQFSTATVTDSLFHNNHEGIRFGRADLDLEHNEFFQNDVAIRFTRMEGPVLINYNKIFQNRLGIFLVPSGQNITDFFEPDRSGSPWNTGRLRITNNDLTDNQWYNLNLGTKQLWDIEVSGNFWGSTVPAEIESTIFDQHRDPELGTAIIQPFAEHSIPTAGVRRITP